MNEEERELLEAVLASNVLILGKLIRLEKHVCDKTSQTGDFVNEALQLIANSKGRVLAQT